MPSRNLVLASASLLAAGVIAGCGGTNNSDTANIQMPPSASQTMTYSATSTSTTSTSTTPTSGALSKAPKITVPSGAAPTTLKTTDLVKGTGATVAAGDTVTVNYVGALYKGGKVFDSSWSRNQPFTTALADTAVIKGWVQGIADLLRGFSLDLRAVQTGFIRDYASIFTVFAVVFVVVWVFIAR